MLRRADKSGRSMQIHHHDEKRNPNTCVVLKAGAGTGGAITPSVIYMKSIHALLLKSCNAVLRGGFARYEAFVHVWKYF